MHLKGLIQHLWKKTKYQKMNDEVKSSYFGIELRNCKSFIYSISQASKYGITEIPLLLFCTVFPA